MFFCLLLVYFIYITNFLFVKKESVQSTDRIKIPGTESVFMRPPFGYNSAGFSQLRRCFRTCFTLRDLADADVI